MQIVVEVKQVPVLKVMYCGHLPADTSENYKDKEENNYPPASDMKPVYQGESMYEFNRETTGLTSEYKVQLF